MSIMAFAGKKTVLIITDDVLLIYSSAIGEMELVANLKWDIEDFDSRLFTILKRDCGAAPITILNDAVEQHYQKGRVRKSGTGAFDRRNMLRHKLKAAFPSYPMRAALALKEKTGEKVGKENFSFYIFVALQGSEKIQKLINVIQRPEFTVKGLYMLPVESSDMVGVLSARILKRGSAKKAGWTIFIGQNESGGLRQIVTRNGELALTRITPIVDMHEEPENWVIGVYEEFKATMSYLARFGYEETDGLNVIVIAGEQEGESFKSLVQDDCVCTVLTVAQASKMLGIRTQVASGLNYADILHVGWVAKKAKLVLPLVVPELDKVMMPRKKVAAVSLVLLAALSVQIYIAYQYTHKFSTIKLDLKKTGASQAVLNTEYEEDVLRLKQMGYDVKLVQGTLDIYDRFENQKPDVLKIFKEIGIALEGNLRLDNVQIKITENDMAYKIQNAGFLFSEGEPVDLYNGKLTIVYPSTTDDVQGNLEVTEFKSRLQERLPEHVVEIVKLIKDYEYTEQVVIESGTKNQEREIEQDFVVEIEIKRRSTDVK